MCQTFRTVQDRKAQAKRNCYKCLSENHKSRDCQSTRSCYYCKVPRDHHSSLCYTRFPASGDVSHMIFERTSEGSGGVASGPVPFGDTIEPNSSQPTENQCLAVGERGVFQTASAFVVNPNRPTGTVEKVRVYFDSLSSRSYITTELADRLELRRRDGNVLQVDRFMAKDPCLVSTKVATLGCLLDNGDRLDVPVDIIPVITGRITRTPVSVKGLNKFKNLKLADDPPKETEYAKLDVLIGTDYHQDFLTGERIEVQQGLYLLGSHLGWMLTGRAMTAASGESSSTMLILESYPEQNDFNKIIQNMWSLESIGIKDDPLQTDDEMAMKQYNDTVCFQNGRYHVTWPLCKSVELLPTNYEIAMKRFRTLLRKLKQNPELHIKYRTIIEQQCKSGIVEIVDENAAPRGIVHYIPHHPVETPLKATTKVRIVYDASARATKGSLSLNDCMLRGPVILEDLLGLLVRFRLHRIGIISDIEKAFLQVSLQSGSRDMTRFLWLKDSQNLSIHGNIQVYRFARVPFGMKASPFLLAATVRHHLGQQQSDVARLMASNMYVDNVIVGASSVKEAQSIYKEGKALFASASMNLREWRSNSLELNGFIPTEDLTADTTVKLLGIAWDTISDILQFTFPDEDTLCKASTKRDVLAILSTMFDPLGLCCPLLVEGKLFLQRLCTLKVSWSERLPAGAQSEWNRIASSIGRQEPVKVSRWLGYNPSSICRLVVFSDASERAYGCAVYAVTDVQTGKSSLLFAKSRVCPLKKLSMPRLELMAALVGCRSVNFVRNQLRLNVPAALFVDSQCVLGWLRSEKELCTFVRNRVTEINAAGLDMIRYVPTDDNPADLVTRPASHESLPSIWWHGPSWLSKSESHWPEWPQASSDVEVAEITPKVMQQEDHTFLTTATIMETPFGIPPEKFGGWLKLLRVTAYCLRFANRRPMPTATVTSDELAHARLVWDKAVQKTAFSEVLAAMRLPKIAARKGNSMVHQLGLRLDDDGLVRCHGRLSNAGLPVNAKFPILLPRKSRYTELIIAHCHLRLHHAGTSQTLSHLRMDYWLTGGRAAVRAVLSKCAICRRWDGPPYALPSMPELPASRVVQSCPFNDVGIDYFGPLLIRQTNVDHKTWVALFTCLCTRAVHLELVMSMSTESFIFALRRFSARYGKPQSIVSDNGPSFKATSSVLDAVWQNWLNDAEVKEHAANRGIKWLFIPDFSPWSGGVYERMVGLVKTNLRKVLGRQRLAPEHLTTILAEVQYTVNCRPLTYVGEECTQPLQVLTPNHLLMNSPKSHLPNVVPYCHDDPDFYTKQSLRDNVLLTWRKGQNLLNEFWRLWRNDYLIGLREKLRSNHKVKGRSLVYTPNVGDVVLIGEPMSPRCNWVVGRVWRLNPSSDGAVRSVQVRTPSQAILTRPVNLLYPIELEGPPAPGGGDGVGTPKLLRASDAGTAHSVSVRRPNRRAAEAAKQRIRELADQAD